MKKIVLSLLLTLVVNRPIFGEETKNKIILLNNFTFSIDPSVSDTIAKKTIGNFQKVAALYDSCPTIKRQLSKYSLKENGNTMTKKYDVVQDKDEYIVRDGEEQVISAAFAGDGLIRSIYFKAIGGRNFTREERREYKTTGKIPVTYKTISEEDALKSAEELHRFVYGNDEHKKFDSITIMQHGQEYGIYFNVKVKNDICDSRHSEVIINANSGEIEHFSDEGLSSITFDYIPKIPKNEVIEMYNAEVERLKADIKIREMYLQKYPNKNGENRWAWLIYGDRHDTVLGTSAMMFIDSETGEVLFKKMDY
jgi:uncharacterized membrane protein YkoI